jgi:threonine synthase
MWKAFEEMETLGWIDSHRPKMIAVQAEGCAPIVRAFQQGERFAAKFENAHTAASGLRVPVAVGDFIMLDLIRASGGTAITVSDAEMISAAREIGSKTGISASPEGGAVLAAARHLREDGFLKESETVVLFNTGSALKYAEAFV